MVIDLTNSEKTTFIRFLSLYLGSSFILMTLVAFLYYQNEKTLYFDLTKANMQNVTSKLSSRIISSHMTNTPLDTSKLLETKAPEYVSVFEKLVGDTTKPKTFEKRDDRRKKKKEEEEHKLRSIDIRKDLDYEIKPLYSEEELEEIRRQEEEEALSQYDDYMDYEEYDDDQYYDDDES